MGGAVSAITDVVGDVVEGVGDVVEGAVDVVSDAGSWIDDNVLQPALDDPIATAAKVAAVATGNPQLLPVISGAQTVAAGGDLEDVAKAAGTSYVAGEVGGTVGGEVAGATGSQAAGAIAQGAATGATGSAISGGDIGTGLLTGGINAGIGQGVNAIVDTGYNLLTNANAANTTTVPTTVSTTPTTGTNNMDIFNPFADTVTYGTDAMFTPASTGDAAGYDWNTINNYYDPTAISAALAAGAGQSGTDIASQIGSNVYNSMVGGGTTSWTPSDSIAAANAGVDQNTLTSLLKQFGTTAVKSLLGIGGTTGQAGTATGTSATGGLLGAGVNYFLSQNQLDKLSQAYQQNVAQQQQATQQAVDMSKFTPVGVTTAFGQSQYTVDPTTGRITQAGYTSTPQLQAAQQGLLSAGQAMIPTGNLQQQAQAIYEQQTGLLAPGREQQLAQLRNRLYQRGTSGLATGGTVAGYAPNAQGLMATNPELAAYYNAQAQQNAQLAATSQQQALSQAQGQASLAGSLFGQAGTLESLAQQPLTLGTNLATLQTTAGSKAGQLGLLGGQAAATTGLQGQLAAIYGQGQALGNVVNPLAQAAQQGISTAIGNWLS